MKISIKKIILIVIVVAIVAVGLYVYEMVGKHAIRRSQWVTGSDGQVYQNQTIADEAAREEADPFYVRSIPDVAKVTKLVLEKKDYSLCSKIEPVPAFSLSFSQSDFIDTCRRDSASALGGLGDLSLCKQMDSEYANYCYLQVASIKKDVSICKLINVSSHISESLYSECLFDLSFSSSTSTKSR